jgi:hypothetical protein
VLLNLDAAVTEGARLNGLVFDRMAERMGDHAISDAEARGHFTSWAEEDRYFPLDAELGAARGGVRRGRMLLAARAKRRQLRLTRQLTRASHRIEVIPAQGAGARWCQPWLLVVCHATPASRAAGTRAATEAGPSQASAASLLVANSRAAPAFPRRAVARVGTDLVAASDACERVGSTGRCVI